MRELSRFACSSRYHRAHSAVIREEQIEHDARGEGMPVGSGSCSSWRGLRSVLAAPRVQPRPHRRRRRRKRYRARQDFPRTFQDGTLMQHSVRSRTKAGSLYCRVGRRSKVLGNPAGIRAYRSWTASTTVEDIARAVTDEFDAWTGGTALKDVRAFPEEVRGSTEGMLASDDVSVTTP